MNSRVVRQAARPRPRNGTVPVVMCLDRRLRFRPRDLLALVA
jgi:hypothetical protein